MELTCGKTKTRNEYLDVMKAFSIILVIIGHCIQYGSGADFLSNGFFFENWVFKIIYSFHMPLFMLISGYLFCFSVSKKKWNKLIASKAKTLLVPIAVWVFLEWSFQITWNYIFGNAWNVLDAVKRYFTMCRYSLWFLWAIFLCSTVVAVVRRFCKDNILIYLFGALLTFFVPDSIVFAVYKYVYPFFVIGYLFNRDGGKEKLQKAIQSKITLLVSGLVFAAAMLIYRNHSSVYISGFYILKENPLMQVHNDVYRFFVGLAGSIFVLLLVYQIGKVAKKKERKLLTLIGRDTMGIYIISGFVFSYFFPKITANLATVNYLVTIGETVVVLFVSLLGTEVIKRIKILNKLLLGDR